MTAEFYLCNHLLLAHIYFVTVILGNLCNTHFRVVAENSWNDEQRINLQYEQLVGSMLARFNDLAMSAPTQKEKDIFVGLKRAVENTMRQKFCLWINRPNRLRCSFLL